MDRTTGKMARRTAGSECVPATLDGLLREWQAAGCERTFELLVHMATPIVERHVRRTLHASGIHDPAAVDDAVALVLDHLRRLPGTTAGERRVGAFAAADHPKRSNPDALTFVRLLSQSRARDVARTRRRASRHERPFATLDAAARDRVYAITAAPSDSDRATDQKPRLLAALAVLDGRERSAVSLRLEGKSLAVVAHVLGVCEGTASRIHARAVGKLRAALQRGISAGARVEACDRFSERTRPGYRRSDP